MGKRLGKIVGMSPGEAAILRNGRKVDRRRKEMMDWYRRNRPVVDRWLKANPPPREWTEDRIAWAFMHLIDLGFIDS